MLLELIPLNEIFEGNRKKAISLIGLCVIIFLLEFCKEQVWELGLLSLLAEACGGGFPWYHSLEMDLGKELPLMVECCRSSHGRFKKTLVPGIWDAPEGNCGAHRKLTCHWVSVCCQLSSGIWAH